MSTSMRWPQRNHSTSLLSSTKTNMSTHPSPPPALAIPSRTLLGTYVCDRTISLPNTFGERPSDETAARWVRWVCWVRSAALFSLPPRRRSPPARAAARKVVAAAVFLRCPAAAAPCGGCCVLSSCLLCGGGPDTRAVVVPVCVSEPAASFAVGELCCACMASAYLRRCALVTCCRFKEEADAMKRRAWVGQRNKLASAASDMP